MKPRNLDLPPLNPLYYSILFTFLGWHVCGAKSARFVFSCENIKGHQTGGGVQTGGFPDLDFFVLFCPFLSFFVLFCPFLSFFVLFCPFPIFWDFPDLFGDGPGIFPICPFPLSQPIKSTYEEQSRKGPQHNLDLSREKWETPRFGNLPV